MSEQDLENQILDALNRIPGVFALKYKPQATFDPVLMIRRKACRFTPKGVADAIILVDMTPLPLLVFFLEFKMPHGKQSQEQKGFEFRIKKMNGDYFVVTSQQEALRCLDHAKSSFKEKISSTHRDSGNSTNK